MQVLGTEPKSSERIAGALNHSSPLKMPSYTNCVTTAHFRVSGDPRMSHAGCQWAASW